MQAIFGGESENKAKAVGDGGWSHGLVQWNDSEGSRRWTPVSNWLKANNYDTDSFEGQVRAIYGAEGNKEAALTTIKNYTDVSQLDDATTYICDKYERPGNKRYDVRKEGAWYAYNLYNNYKANNKNKKITKA